MRAAVLLCCWLVFPALGAAQLDTSGETSAQDVEAGNAAWVVITGLGGEPRFDESFHTWAATLMDAAVSHGVAPDDVTYLAADAARDRATARSTKETVRQTFADLAKRLEPDAPLFVFVIAHGSHRDGVSKINLPGPDLTATDVAEMLDPFGERGILFANLSSASGGFLTEVARPGRVTITATRSGAERNASVFARFFAAALVGDAADVDNDGQLSVLEAFGYARLETERFYDSEQKLLTEHAVLDDDGDGEGSPAPSADSGDGKLASSMLLTTRRGSRRDSQHPEMAQRKSEIEAAISDLRQRKESLSLEDYETQLEDLLVELALANRALRGGAGT